MGRNLLVGYGAFWWILFLVGQDSVFIKFMLDNTLWLGFALGLIFLVAFLVWGGCKLYDLGVAKRHQANIVLAQTQKAFDSLKKYEPIPGIRYKPHWYLQDALPRNVVPKKLPPALVKYDVGLRTVGSRATVVENDAGMRFLAQEPWTALDSCGCYECDDCKDEVQRKRQAVYASSDPHYVNLYHGPN